MDTYRQILVKYWGYDGFRPLQEEIIHSVMEGNDTLALMPTGGGKSITFQVPALAKEGICLVITPLIALMRDQVDNLNRRGIKAIAVHSGMSKHEIDLALDNCIFGGYKFLYLSPERLATDLFKARVEKMTVNLVAIDESHCISQWGYDFRPSYLNIANLREHLKDNPPFLALTATATPDVVKDIQGKLKFRKNNVLKKSFERKNLVYLVRNVENKIGYITQSLKKIQGTGIVYTRSRARTEKISELLAKTGFSSDFYHAGLDPDIRNKKQDEWQKGHIKIMVATNAFGMGIDKPDVRFVIHFDLPDTLEAYFQEAGRAGRDEKRAFAVLLYNNTDRVKAEQRKEQNFPPINEIKDVYEALGNYLHVPYEGGKNQAYDFNIYNFISNYKFNLMNVYSSLKFLQKEGYIELTDELSNKSKIHFIVSRDDLYNFQLSNERYDIFIKLLLRSYTGVFTNYVKIEEKAIAKKLNAEVETIYKILNRLKYFKIIDYIPYKKTPMIVYTEERLKRKNLYISPENYKDRKKQYVNKLNAVLEYAENDRICRSIQLLKYFGEKDAYRCGHCDVCLQKNELQLSSYQFDSILKQLKGNLLDSQVTIEQLIEQVDYDKEKVLKVFNWLLEHKKIVKADGDLYTWNK
ncbi:MAG: ATP-dependent DNA helicase RecQ [Bacteroidales bacterium]